jgi:hypothetical protein
MIIVLQSLKSRTQFFSQRFQSMNPPVLRTPGKIIRPGHQKNLAAGRKILLYPAAVCMISVDLCFFTTIQTIFWRAVTQQEINVKSNVIQYTERDYVF